MKESYFIRTRHMEEALTVSEEEFKDYFRQIDTYRKKQQRHGKCVCPEKERQLCDMDCSLCPHYRPKREEELDAPAYTEGDEDITFCDLMTEAVPDLSDAVTDRLAFQAVLKRLKELMPEALEFGELRMAGLSRTEIYEVIGLKRTTCDYQLKKAQKILCSEFPEILENFFE